METSEKTETSACRESLTSPETETLIQEISPETLKAFLRSKTSGFSLGAVYNLSHYNDEKFLDFQKAGEISFEDGEKAVVVIVKVQDALTERACRKTQYEKAKRILKELNYYPAGLFVFRDAGSNFRFSLVCEQTIGTRRKFENFRRFTFYVNPKENTNKTFRIQMGKTDFSTLAGVKEVFSVDKVTKAFFEELSHWYLWAVKSSVFAEDVGKDKNGKNIAVIRMITRLIFIWFMKQKQLAPDYFFKEADVKDILLDLAPGSGSYYKAILQNLFFATLNTPANQRKFRTQKEFNGYNKDFMEHSYYRYEKHFKDPGRILSLFKDIPFLNGGLFDCLDERLGENKENRYIRIDGFSDRSDNPLHVPNFLFFSAERNVDLNKEYGTKNKKYPVRGLINILESYNFTINENTPVDEEIALDPELLGRVFENLLASYNPDTATTARKSTGSYYTPREIISYMVEQSLKEYFKTKLPLAADLDKNLDILLSYNTDANPFDNKESAELINAVNQLKIIDPAVGSGAFPMGILQKLVLVLSKLDPHNEKWEKQQIEAVERNVSDGVLKKLLIAEIERNFRKNELDYGRKLYLIQNCIYGVDIQPIAMQIAKLRFFISLLVDEKLDVEEKDKGIKPLPNLDFKLVCANSLIGLPEVPKPSSDNHALTALESEKQELGKEYVRKLNSGKLDIFEKKQIGDRLKNIDKKIAAIPQSGCDEGDSHSLFSSSDTLSGLQDVRAKYFAATSKAEKNKLKDKFFKIQEQIRAEVGWSVKGAVLTRFGEHEEIKLKTKTKGTEKAAKLGFWDPFSNKSGDWFDPEWMFGVKGGFDIIIANPPYINIEKLPEQTKKHIFKIYNCCVGRTDIYIAFLSRSIELLCESGVLSFIIPYAFTNQKYGEPLRATLAQNHHVAEIVDVSEYFVFESAHVKNIILRIGKLKHTGPTIIRLAKNASAFESRTFEEHFINQNEFLSMKDCRFETKDIADLMGIKTKVASGTVKFEDVCFIAYGARLNHKTKDIGKEHYIFEAPKTGYKPYSEGKDIERYFCARSAWLNYKPNEHYNPMFAELFENEKLVFINVVKDKLRFAYDITHSYNSHTVINCVKWDLLKEVEYISVRRNIAPMRIKNGETCNYRFLLALLNSSLMNWYFDNFLSEKLHFYPDDAKNLPIKIAPIKEQDTFALLADKILKAKAKDAEADTTDLEDQIDQLVYKLYNLTPEEIKIVESAK